MTGARQEPSSQRAWVIAAGILVAVGVTLRLAWPQHISFGGEQVESVALAWKSWREGGTDHGLRVSMGVDMPPFYLWLLSLPVALTRDPVRVTQFVILLNLVGLAGLFLMLRSRRSNIEAWLVTALCATAPWSIVFARKIWAQDVLFPFAVAFFAVYLSALERPRPWKTWLGFLLLGTLAQIYPAAWFLLPPLVLTAWLSRLRISLRDAAIGVLLVGILWWPHVRYQIAVDFDDWRYTLSMFGGGGGHAPGRGLVPQMLGVWQLSGGTGLAELLGQEGYADWQSHPIARGVTVLASAFLVACAASTAWAAVILTRALRARVFGLPLPPGVLTLFAAVLLGVPVEYALLGLPALPHYQIVVQPAVAVLVVAGAVEIARRWPGRFGWRTTGILFATITGFAFLHALQWASLQSFVVDRPGAIIGSLGPIYAGSRDQMDRELADALEDVATGEQRRAAEDARRADLFARSTDVLLEYSGVRGEPALHPVGGITLEPRSDGTCATVRVPPAFVDLPEFPVRDRGKVLVRIDITSPIEAYLTVFFQTAAHRDYRRTQKVVQKLPRGRSFHYVLLDAPELRGPLRLWLGQRRSIIHAIDVRALE